MEQSPIPQISQITEKIRQIIPAQYLIQTNRAFITFFGSVFLYAFGLFLLSNLHWTFLPIGWIFLGTVLSGLRSVGYDCASGSFSQNEFINEIIGNVVSMPLLNPYEPWKLQNLKESEIERLSKLVTGPLWWLSSVFSWIKSNFDLRSIYLKGHRRRIWASLCCTYIFAAIYFSTVLYNAGFWGIFKYFLIPWSIYHFWISTFITTSCRNRFGEISDLVVHVRYPKLIEVLTNNMNYVMTRELYQVKVPNWYLKQSFTKLSNELGKMYHQKTFFSELIATLKSNFNDISSFLKIINWPTAIFLFSTPILAIFGLATVPIQKATFLLALFSYFTFGIGITMGYHRYFAHHSFDAIFPLRVIMMIMGTGAFEGSILWWCRDHRAHHRYSDTEKDPYGVDKGFFWSHIGWLLVVQDESKIGKCSMVDLESDPLLRWQDRYYVPFALTVGIIVPTCIAGFGWGDWAGGFFIASMARIVLVNQATFCINSVAHYFGDQPFDDKRSARDSYFCSLITFGEGYHNFHHEFPYDFRNGLWNLAYDPSKWTVYLLSLVGFTYNLKRFSENEINKGIVQMKQKKLDQEKSLIKWGPTVNALPEFTMEQVQNAVGSSLIVIDGFVHDVTSFIKEHPGGEALLKSRLRTDASKSFNGDLYTHSNGARNLLSMLRVGVIRNTCPTTKEKGE